VGLTALEGAGGLVLLLGVIAVQLAADSAIAFAHNA
jgi:hypothetical protein